METTLSRPSLTPVPSIDAQFSPPNAEQESAPYRFSAEQYFRMIDAGVFDRATRVELRDGVVYEKMSKNRPYEISSEKLTRKLIRLLPDGWYVGNASTLALSESDCPLPDLLIVRGEPDHFRHRRPSAADANLVVEIAESSLKGDTGSKLSRYAKAGVGEYWVVNLVDRVLQVYRLPNLEKGQFQEQTTYSVDELIPLRFDGVDFGMLPVRDILPANE